MSSNPVPVKKRCLAAFLFVLILSVGSSFSSLSAAAPLTKENFYQMGVMATRDGAYEQAIEFFKKAIELDPRFSAAYNGLGVVFESGPMADARESVRYFRLAVDIDPQSVDALNNLGRACYSSGDFSQAAQALSRSLGLKPVQPDIEVSLAWVYLLGQSNADGALPFFEKNLNRDDNTMLYYGAGLCYMILNQRARVMDAITALRFAKREDLAVRLEDLLKQRVKIVSEKGRPLVTGTEQERSFFVDQINAFGQSRFDADSKSEGIQVRLRGAL